MAGSWNHITNEDGTFSGVALIDDLGDAFEALEECYGMIQWLTEGSADRIREAQERYREGVRLGGSVPYDEQA